MTNILRFVQVFALGTWVGSIFYFSAAVAPGAFRVLPSQDLAGALVEFTLKRLHTLGVAAGGVFLVASALLAVSASASRRSVLLSSIGVAIMVVLTVISQHLVIRRMMMLRREMGSVAETAADSPLRIEFNRLHQVSVQLEGATLLIGFASLFLTVRAKP
jgi:uncharacterized membrane protein